MRPLPQGAVEGTWLPAGQAALVRQLRGGEVQVAHQRKPRAEPAFSATEIPRYGDGKGYVAGVSLSLDGHMRWRWVFVFTVWMAVGTGCPETWREGGTLDRAMAKDIAEELHRHGCYLDDEEWDEKCDVPSAQWDKSGCPHECRFRAGP